MRYCVDNLVYGDISRPYVNNFCHSFVKQEAELGGQGEESKKEDEEGVGRIGDI